MSEMPVEDDEICCICMEEKTNVILACTHNFCEKCIHEWKITSNTCPICRKRTADQDCFILTEKPDYYDLQDEMSKSLFQITEGRVVERKSRQRPNPAPTSAVDSSYDTD